MAASLNSFFGERTLQEDFDSLADGEAKCHFPAGNGVGNAVGVVVDELFLDIVGEGGDFLDVGDDLGFDLLVDRQEGFFIGG